LGWENVYIGPDIHRFLIKTKVVTQMDYWAKIFGENISNIIHKMGDGEIELMSTFKGVIFNCHLNVRYHLKS
jgi:hypothetical protein